MPHVSRSIETAIHLSFSLSSHPSTKEPQARMPEAVDHAFLHPLFLPDLLNDCICPYFAKATQGAAISLRTHHIPAPAFPGGAGPCHPSDNVAVCGIDPHQTGDPLWQMRHTCPTFTQRGGFLRRVWGVRAQGSGVSAGQHLTKEEGDHVPAYPLSRRAAAMGRVQPACRGGP
jgi:hypothetical protein